MIDWNKINGGFLAPDRVPMEERNKDEMILELQKETHEKDKEIERLNKDYKILKELQMKTNDENNRLNNIINRIDNFVDKTIEVIKQQPLGNDEWILERLNGIKYLTQGSENDD